MAQRRGSKGGEKGDNYKGGEVRWGVLILRRRRRAKRT